ncbi:LysE family translocator [Leptolyngbya sp. FACHB-261]|uniref:LysE family translocator n=1 Tax=Leptolyngbya sp. FACHB-261 TaxID=2692806 RepID=UPI00168272BF|nr:LysE family translocator [Leptolyngbya sp. FACHB-261]MBD2103533.1 LysE family translocator [Leptolyngbya sp. FACHB-261]
MQPPGFLLFLTTATLLIITPGPDMLYVITRGVAQGRRTALLSTLGICSGYVIHTFFAVLGLSALLQSSAAAFEIIRYAGAAYLLYLGIQTLLSKQRLTIASAGANSNKLNRVVWQGIITSVLNPKGILFFIAFLPQFVDPNPSRVGIQLFALGLTFTTLCFLIYGTLGYVAGTLRDRLAGQVILVEMLRYLAGTVLVGLGIRLALSEQK